jgi:hypothetical protein
MTDEATEDQVDVPIEGEAPTLPLTPEARARPTLRGEVEIEVGPHRWTMADYIPEWHPVWDQLFDEGNLGGKYPPDRLRLAAFHILWANYAVTADEGAALVLGMPLAELVEAVQTAMYGIEKEHYSSARTFTQWLRFSLLANGLDPDRMAPWDRRPMVHYHVACGLALPAANWIGSAAALARRARNDADL